MELLQGDNNVTSMMVTLSNADLFGGFAQAFNSLCTDKDVPLKTKIALTKLRRAMMVVAKDLSYARDLLKEKGDKATPEDIKVFEDLMSETNDFPFNKLDAIVVAKNLSVIDLDALTPILKGV